MKRGRIELGGYCALPWLLALLTWTVAGCNQLDPIKTTDLCDNAGDISENCPKCLTSPVAPGCPQCRGDNPPAGCFDVGMNVTPTQTEPQGGEGASGTGADATGGGPSSGAAASGGGNAGRSGGRAPQGGNASGGTTGTTPINGAAGVGTGPQVPSLNNCLDGGIKCDREGARVCLPTGRCGECSLPEHCPGRACDTVSATCVDCMADTDCADDAKVCQFSSRTCIECRTSPDCKQDGLRACDTQTNTCVECVDGTSPNGCQPERPACQMQKCVECTSDTNCPPSKSRCITEETRCVQCKQNPDCQRLDPKKPVCFVDDNTCVQCNADSDCKDPNASHCNPSTHSCEACTAVEQCKHISGLTECDTKSRKCVECVEGGRTCGRNACILSTHECSTVVAGSRGLCEECASRTECAGAECVPTTAQGKNEGGRCLQATDRPCSRPNPRVLNNVKSVDGPTVSVCAPASQTSCKALLDSESKKACPDGNPLSCGWGTNDGFCDAQARTCTNLCDGASECPPLRSCDGEPRRCM